MLKFENVFEFNIDLRIYAYGGIEHMMFVMNYP